MEIRPIRTEEDYEAAMARIEDSGEHLWILQIPMSWRFCLL